MTAAHASGAAAKANGRANEHRPVDGTGTRGVRPGVRPGVRGDSSSSLDLDKSLPRHGKAGAGPPDGKLAVGSMPAGRSSNRHPPRCSTGASSGTQKGVSLPQLPQQQQQQQGVGGAARVPQQMQQCDALHLDLRQFVESWDSDSQAPMERNPLDGQLQSSSKRSSKHQASG